MKLRKKFGIILLSCLIITSLLLSGTAYAQEEELPDPGITPDSPFYFFDNWGKRIGLFFAFGSEAKARKALEYAEERLAEAQAMAIRNRIRELEQATNGYNEFLAIVAERAEEARQQGISDNISERVALATSKHLSVLDRIKDTIPEQAREAIAQTKEASINGQQNALRALVRERLERAAEINLAAIEGRLNRAKAKADEGNTEEVEDVLDDADKMFRFGEEISEIARGLGKDTTTVEQLVAQATSVHLEVLAEIHEKVPEQARVSIENAIANSLVTRERVVEALKNKGALGEIPEEAPVLERIREEVQERIQEQVSEQISNLKPGVPKPVVSENETEEKESPSPEPEREQSRKP